MVSSKHKSKSMKKFTFSLLFVSSLTFLPACGGGGIEGDASKMANYACSAMKFRTQGSKGMEGLKKVEKDMKEFKIKLQEKYKEDKDKQELMRLIDEKLKSSCRAANPMKY